MGLIALLITFVIIVFVIWRFSFVGGKEGQSVIERDRQAIDQAEMLKNKIETQDQERMKDL